MTREQLLDLIQRGSAPGATPTDREAGSQACQAMGALLGAQPGQPLNFGAPPPPPRPTFSTLLDLASAQLRAFLDAQQKKQAETSAPQPQQPHAHTGRP